MNYSMRVNVQRRNADCLPCKGSDEPSLCVEFEVMTLYQNGINLFDRLRKDSRLSGIIHGGLSALLSRGVGILVSAISLPLTVRYLGPQQYGIWVTVSTTVMMLGVLDLGVANSLTNLMSRAYAQEDRVGAQRFYSTAFWVSTLIACALGLGALAVWPLVPWAALFHLSDPSIAREASLCVGVALVFFLVGLPLNLVHRALSGYQQTQVTNYFNLISGVIGLVVIVFVIRLHGSLLTLMICYTGSFLAGTVVLNLWVNLWSKRWILPNPRVISRDAAKELMNSGFGFLVLQLAGIIVFSSDNLVITHYLGPAQVAPYSVTWRLASYATLLQTALYPSLWPAYSEAFARRDFTWMRQAFWNAARVSMGTASAALIVLAIFGRHLIHWYVGPTAVPGQLLLVTICGWTLLSTGMELEACLLAAINRVKLQGFLSVIAAALNIIFSIYLVKRIGSLGVVVGTMASYLLVLVVPQTVIVWRALYKEPLEARSPTLAQHV